MRHSDRSLMLSNAWTGMSQAGRGRRPLRDPSRLSTSYVAIEGTGTRAVHSWKEKTKVSFTLLNHRALHRGTDSGLLEISDPGDYLNLRVLDPAVGTGVFLAEALEQISARVRNLIGDDGIEATTSGIIRIIRAGGDRCESVRELGDVGQDSHRRELPVWCGP